PTTFLNLPNTSIPSIKHNFKIYAGGLQNGGRFFICRFGYSNIKSAYAALTSIAALTVKQFCLFV
ncbi:MAG: hypothetical protein IJP05_03830, partial [Oscillospiraceae bacterium]|nr:hypothetical protein [Oscillospiraceae bacterium]